VSTISSTLSAGINTIQSGQYRVDQAAGEIAAAPVASEMAQQQSGSAQSNQNAEGDVAENLIQMQVGQYQVQAGARVVTTADELLGTIIDVSV
jgi:flagellar hook protein FlgE